jgi:hypothetical protein
VDWLSAHDAQRAAALMADKARRNDPAVRLFPDCFALQGMPMMSWDGGKGAMTVTNGLYTIHIEMTDGGHGRAHGVIVLHDGKIAGGDSRRTLRDQKSETISGTVEIVFLV